jgi:hypothetical protein
MSPERETIREPKSEICADPEILLEKVRSLSEHPEDKTGRAAFREWLLKDWRGINELLLQFPSEPSQQNEHIIIRYIILGDYGIYKNSNSNVRIGNIVEEAPCFVDLEGVDRAKVTLHHQSNKTDECKKNGGKDVYMDILFLADGENRDNLLALSIKAQSKSPSGILDEHFEVKISPKLQINKISPDR